MKEISIIPLITLTPTLQIRLDFMQRQRHVTSSPAATWPRREHKSTLRAPKSLVQITHHATTSIKLVATVCLLSLPKDILFFIIIIIIIIIIIPAMPRHTKGRGCYQAQAAQATSDQLGRFKVIQQTDLKLIWINDALSTAILFEEIPTSRTSIDYSISLTSMDALEQLHHGHWFSATYFWSEKLEVTRFQPQNRFYKLPPPPPPTQPTQPPSLLVLLTPRCSRFQGKTCQPWHLAHTWAEGHFLIQLLNKRSQLRSRALIWDLCCIYHFNMYIHIYISLLSYTLSTCVFIRDCVVALADKNSLFHINGTLKKNGFVVIVWQVWQESSMIAMLS